ncbi:MAG TPA: hypothetical protein VLA45_04250, partial [Paracoccaceae bacterium]|nr:hypothetical protein [Paracoccaceae bacterium]
MVSISLKRAAVAAAGLAFAAGSLAAGPESAERVARGAKLSTKTSASAAAKAVSTKGTAEESFAAYVTGYSYWDNTPPGSSEISHPVVHRRAGGTGTYDDPITLAVGHQIIGGRDLLDYQAGTRFYLKSLRKYAIVEDTCGDGFRPQAGPCHTGYKGNPWLDIYVDGAGSRRAASDQCMNKITRIQTVIVNPARN